MADQKGTESSESQPKSHLSPDRHPQRDFFVADILDASLKDDMASMEHPLFALQAGDMAIHRYEHNGKNIEVQPGAMGLATIHDKDIWIYCISQLVEAINRGRHDTGRVVNFTAYDFLTTTNRGISGDSYEAMGQALARLRGTSIVTNIETAGQREREGFGLIDSWKIVEKSKTNNRMVAVSVTLPEWLYRSVEAKQVLTLSRDYFRLRKPLDRRVYELARKHCGNQPKWVVSVALLHTKSGSRSPLPKFRLNVKALAESRELPDYSVVFNKERDTVTFYAQGQKGAKAQIDDILKAKPPKRPKW